MIFEYPRILTFLVLVFSLITMSFSAATASAIKDTHEQEYKLSIANAVICGTSVILTLFIIGWSLKNKENIHVVLGFSD